MCSQECRLCQFTIVVVCIRHSVLVLLTPTENLKNTKDKWFTNLLDNRWHKTGDKNILKDTMTLAWVFIKLLSLYATLSDMSSTKSGCTVHTASQSLVTAPRHHLHSVSSHQLVEPSNWSNPLFCVICCLVDLWTWFLLLCRIHFPWLSRTKWIVFPD